MNRATIKSKEVGKIEILIYEKNGRKVYSTQKYFDGVSPIPVNTSELSGGFYILSVKSSGGTSIGSFAVSR